VEGRLMLLLLAAAVAQDYGVSPEALADPVQAGNDLVAWGLGGGGGAGAAALVGYLLRERIGKGLRAFMGQEAEPAAPAPAAPADAGGIMDAGCSAEVEDAIKALTAKIGEIERSVAILTERDPITGAPLLHPGKVQSQVRENGERLEKVRDALTHTSSYQRDMTRSLDALRLRVDAVEGLLSKLQEGVNTLLREVVGGR